MKTHSFFHSSIHSLRWRPLLPVFFACGIWMSPVLRAADAVAPVAATAAMPAAEPEAPPATVPSAAPVSSTAPSQNVMVNLINLMVKRGLLLPQDAEALVSQAETDAAAAREKQVVAQASAGNAAARPPAGASTVGPSAPAAAEDEVRVTYVPEAVKAEMRDQIKQEVMEQARQENWAAPRTLPEWASRFRFSGDVRVRYEGDFFPAGNDAKGGLVDFNSINKGNPFDVSAISNPNFFPTYNGDQNRNRIRLRARFGVEADLTNGFTAGGRVATGESNSPVSQNQSFGYAGSGQGGDFSNYSIWLDRGFIKYETGDAIDRKMAVSVGRFDNPFFSPSQLVWYKELAFDGLAVQGRYRATETLAPFGTVGGFPVYNTDLNFASNQPQKFKSEDKWLVGAQGGTEWKINKDFTLKASAAFYDFENIEGRVSSPHAPASSSDVFDTDGTRPSFAQKGNTYMALRNIQPDAYNSSGTTNLYQYYGLATGFRDAVISARLDYSGFDPLHMWMTGEFVKNVAFNRGRLNSYAQNNLDSNGHYAGGDSGWTTALNVGRVSLEKRWDWNVSVGYKYVESDAVVDGFTDPDFGGGGTNLQGYTVGGNVLISPHISAGFNWMSADSIGGPTFREDVLQLDLNAKF